MSVNNLKTLQKPSEESDFDYDLLKGNLNISQNDFECSLIDVEWFIQLYDYPKFDKSIKCALTNGTKVNVYSYLQAKRSEINPHTTSRLNILVSMLLILVILVIVTLTVYFVRRKHVKLR